MGHVVRDSLLASTHEWTVHRRRQTEADYINESGQCPVCNRTFLTRLRAIKHVAWVAACRDGLASGYFKKIPQAQWTKLDRVEARAVRKSGISVYRSHGLRAVWSLSPSLLHPDAQLPFVGSLEVV